MSRCILTTAKDEAPEFKVTKRLSTIRRQPILDIIDTILLLTEDQPLVTNGQASKYIKVLSERMNVTPIQALLFTVFIENHDDGSINYNDIRRHFRCGRLEILKHQQDIDELVKRGYIIQRKDSDNFIFRVPKKTISCLCNNTLPEPTDRKNLTPEGWMEALDEQYELFSSDELEDEDFSIFIDELFSQNQHLNCVQKIHDLKLTIQEMKLFLAIARLAINDADDHITYRDIDDYYTRNQFGRVRRTLETGTSRLFDLNLIEFVCEEGRANNREFRLTDHSKMDIFSEFDMKRPTINQSNILNKDIISKPLFYNDEITRQIETLKDLLKPERMDNLLKRLEEKGMRKGFACLLYGAPGTGKTETVLQLAKQSGRDIMQVNIASIRSKWVGESEQNIKEIFNVYKKQAHANPNAPILLFNEADALFNTRNEDSSRSVDKMENAMQNIILQEMENLEGILIATTNLSGSLDPAFERRFLFKIEFTKPTPSERIHIWQAMMPSLSEKEALSLAERYDFSGGQIENIARKHEIDSILKNNDTLDMKEIIDACNHELLHKEQNKHIGFVA